MIERLLISTKKEGEIDEPPPRAGPKLFLQDQDILTNSEQLFGLRYTLDVLIKTRHSLEVSSILMPQNFLEIKDYLKLQERFESYSFHPYLNSNIGSNYRNIVNASNIIRDEYRNILCLHNKNMLPQIKEYFLGLRDQKANPFGDDIILLNDSNSKKQSHASDKSDTQDAVTVPGI